jgi:hypothetical protein
MKTYVRYFTREEYNSERFNGARMFQIKLQRKIKHSLYAIYLSARLAFFEVVKQKKLFNV